MKKKKESNFVPLDAENVRRSVEVQVKTIPKEEIEKIEKKGKVLKKTRKTRKATRGVRREIKVKDGYTLIITEKPQAAGKIASALSSKSKKKIEGSVHYYELERDGRRIVIAAAVGHLFTLTQTEKRSKWPNFDIKWEANFKVRKRDWSQKYYKVLSKLVKGASDFVVATDFDVEGEVIGWNILRFIAKQKDAKRMKFSSLTKLEVEKAYNNMLPTIAWGQAIAGETRHYLDWFYGINLSRGLMNAIKKAGSFRIMSIGRVQGPSLGLIVKREKEIQKFKPEPFWQIFIKVEDIYLQHTKNITKKKDLKKFEDLKGKEADVSTKVTEQEIMPPAPFDLTTLQTEAYKFFSLSPSQSLRVAQSLYLAGLISYPRTSSQKIPEEVDYKTIIKKLSSIYKETKLCIRGKPVEGKKSDPAHPSIYPTGDYADLSGDEKKLYDLIVKRFLSCFCGDAHVENKTLLAVVDNLKFSLRGVKIKEKGWMAVYKAKVMEKELESLDGKYKIKEVKIDEKETKPPKRYTSASLVSELAKRNLGTKATRAMIVETLYDRGYIKEKSIVATPLGISLVNTLEKYSPIIVDEELTRKFEKDMEEIQTAKKDLEEKEKKIIDKAKKTITIISKTMKRSEDKIGKALVKANKNLRKLEIEENTLSECPACKKGNLRILYNRKSRRYFIGCSNYPKCRNTYTLPPDRLIKRTDKICEKCGWMMLMGLKKGKRPWIFCFNPDCETNREWQEKRKKLQEESKKNNSENE